MFAVFKKNFISFFLNPSGFIYAFVLLCSAAAFLPDDFVNMNLANIAQLNRWFPLIMLFFVPTLTMGVWADERKFGTEELLLTAPISPAQILIGKYLAVSGVYGVSLIFSAVSNFAVLSFLGRPDSGLFLATYFGFFLTGLAMIALAMTASFLTSQLTVAYIGGALINVVPIALQWSDAAPIPPAAAAFFKRASFANFFEPFGRGSAALSGILYYLFITALALGVCYILLRRRYGAAYRSAADAAHLLFRFAAASVLAVSTVGLIRQHDFRSDWTAEKLGTLSPETLDLIDRWRSDWPVVIDAYISPNLPPECERTKMDMIAVLDEIKNRLKGRAFLTVHETEPNTLAAYKLEQQYDLRPKKVVFDQRGQVRESEVFLTAIFRSGPRTSVIAFLHRGLSAEYELVVALRNVGQHQRKKIGVLNTDASLFGRFDRFGDPITRPWPIIEELSRQYTVTSLDASEPIDPKVCDVVLAVQPSTLDENGMTNFIRLVRSGKPTLIFEDPWPLFVADSLAGTKVPKRPKMSGGSILKGQIDPLWSLLGIFFETDILWKNYNPYPKLAGLSEEFLFIDARPIRRGDDEKSDTKQHIEAFDSNDPATAGLSHLLFPFTGFFVPDPSSGTDVRPMIRTSAGGISPTADILSLGIRSRSRRRVDREGVYTLAARITGDIPRMFRRPEEKPTPKLNVILTADVDWITPGFFTLREMGTDARSGVLLDFDNVTFLLNAVDTLAAVQREENSAAPSESDGEGRSLIALRGRRARHRTLTTIEEATQKIRDLAASEQIAVMKDFERECQEEEAKLNQKIAEWTNRGDLKSDSPELAAAASAMQQRLTRLFDEKKEQYNRQVEESRRRVDESVRQIQGRYKFYAVLIPPLFPIFIGFLILSCRFYHQRKERR